MIMNIREYIISFLFRSNLNAFSARKTRDTIMKMIYYHLFKFIISSVNGVFEHDLTKGNRSINILDIAGLGINICTFNMFLMDFIHRNFNETNNSYRML